MGPSIGSGDQLITIKEKHGAEIRSESLSQDGSHWWIRISSGLNFVRDLTEEARICETTEDSSASTGKTRYMEPESDTTLSNEHRQTWCQTWSAKINKAIKWRRR